MSDPISTIDLLRFFSVRVNSGSGCIIEANSQAYSVVLTAAHNISETASIEVYRFNDKINRIKVLDVYRHSSLDLALITIEKIPNHSFQCGLGKPLPGEQLSIFGYPQRLRNEVESREELIVTCNYLNEQATGFEMTAGKNLFNFNSDAAANVVGFSGSGIFSAIDNVLVLKGIFCELKDAGGANDKLNGLLLDGFLDIVSERGLVDLIANFKSEKVNPYRGVDRFTKTYWPYYYGREEEIDSMFSKLTRANIIVVFGTSGSGKSSLVRAGFEKGRQKFEKNFSKILVSLEFDLSVSPYHGFKTELSNFLNAQGIDSNSDSEPDQMLVKFNESRPEQQLVLILDQFERLVNQQTSADEIDKFIDVILKAIDFGIMIIVAARIDYYAILIGLQKIGKLIASNVLTIFPLSEQSLYNAINLPAQKNACLVEAALTSRLVADTLNSKNALVLLELALFHIYEFDGTSGLLKKSTFEKQSTFNDLASNKTLTGVQGMLVRLAESQYAQLSASEKTKAPFVFISLLTTYKDATQLSAVNIATKKAYLSEVDEETQTVVKKMADSFLIAMGYDEYRNEKTFEIGHEALLIHWPRLKGWVHEYEEIMSWMTNKFNTHYSIYKGDNKHHLPLIHCKEADRWEKLFPFMFTPQLKLFLAKSRRHYRIQRGSLIIVSLIVLLILGILIRNRQKQVFAKANDNLQRGLIEIGHKDYYAALGYLQESLKYRTNEEIRNTLLQAKMLAYVPKSSSLLSDFKAVSLSGNFAVLSDSMAISIWSVPEAKVVFKLPAAKGKITKAFFSPDTDFVVIGTDTGELMIVQLSTHKTQKIPSIGSNSISSISLSGDNKWLAWGDESNNLIIYDLILNKYSQRITGTSPIWALQFSSDSKHLFTGGNDKLLQAFAYDAQRWGLKYKVVGGTDVINTIAVNRQGNIVAAGISDGSLGLYNASDGKLLYYVNGHGSEIADLEFSPSGQYLLSAGEDDAIKLWSVYPFAEIMKIQQNGREPFRIAFKNSDDEFVVGYKNKTIATWTADHSLYRKISDTLSRMYAIAVDPNSKWIATGSNDGTIFKQQSDSLSMLKIWDLKSFKLQKTIVNQERGDIISLAASPDGKLLAAACKNGKVIIYKTSSWDIVDSVQYPRVLCIVKFDNSGTLYIAGRQDSMKRALIYLYTTTTRELDSVIHDGGSVFDISTGFTSDTFATGGGDHTVRLWSKHQKKEIVQFEKQTRSVWAVSLSKDNSMLAGGFLDRTIKVFDTRTKKVVKEFKGHEGGILTIAFHPSNKWLASAGDDHSVHLWSLDGDNIILKNGKYPIWSLQFSKDGNMLYTCNLGGEIYLYDMNSIFEFMNAK